LDIFPFLPSLFSTKLCAYDREKLLYGYLEFNFCERGGGFGVFSFIYFLYLDALEIKLYRMQFCLLFPSLNLLGEKK